MGLVFLYIQGTFHSYFIYTECYTFNYKDLLDTGWFYMFTFYVAFTNYLFWLVWWLYILTSSLWAAPLYNRNLYLLLKYRLWMVKKELSVRGPTLKKVLQTGRCASRSGWKICTWVLQNGSQVCLPLHYATSTFTVHKTDLNLCYS